MFKTFKEMLNLFQIDGPRNEMLFLIFFQRYLQSQMWLTVMPISGGDKNFINIEWWNPLPIIESFVAIRSGISFVGSQFLFNFFGSYMLPWVKFQTKMDTFVLSNL